MGWLLRLLAGVVGLVLLCALSWAADRPVDDRDAGRSELRDWRSASSGVLVRPMSVRELRTVRRPIHGDVLLKGRLLPFVEGDAIADNSCTESFKGSVGLRIPDEVDSKRAVRAMFDKSDLAIEKEKRLIVIIRGRPEYDEHSHKMTDIVLLDALDARLDGPRYCHGHQ